MTSSPMLSEMGEAPEVVARLFDANRDALDRLASALRHRPRVVVTVARGSSDHAAAFARYGIETALGLVTTSLAPSVLTQYEAPLDLADSLVLAISQSGQSPDILSVVEQARRQGALTAAIVNDVGSPLSHLCQHRISMGAGPERSVAATKTFIASLAAIAALVAAWNRNDALRSAFARLPDRLRQAMSTDWSPAIGAFAAPAGAFIVARGRFHPIACEIALKLKEIAGLHAEAFSAAELMHGPLALVGPDLPMLVLAPQDETLGGLMEAVTLLRPLGAPISVASNAGHAVPPDVVGIKLPAALHPLLDPIVAAQAAYAFAYRVAVARGLDPDAPRNIVKVTRTI